jgi:hypothetical protein
MSKRSINNEILSVKSKQAYKRKGDNDDDNDNVNIKLKLSSRENKRKGSIDITTVESLKYKRLKYIYKMYQYCYCFELIVTMNFIHFNEINLLLMHLSKDIRKNISIDKMYRPISIQGWSPNKYNTRTQSLGLDRIFKLAYFNPSIFKKLKHVDFTSFSYNMIKKMNGRFTFDINLHSLNIAWDNYDFKINTKLFSFFATID